MYARSYHEYDQSGSTHPSNYARRSHLPLGLGVHTSAGYNSLAFLQSDRRLSTGPSGADCLIDRNGDRHILTPEDYFPFHLGKAKWGGLDNDNEALSQRWLGVEIEQKDPQVCTWLQLDSLAEYTVLRGMRFNWRWPYSIIGHYGVAVPLGRRSDPRGFDWGSFMGFLYARAREVNVGGL